MAALKQLSGEADASGALWRGSLGQEPMLLVGRSAPPEDAVSNQGGIYEPCGGGLVLPLLTDGLLSKIINV